MKSLGKFKFTIRNERRLCMGLKTEAKENEREKNGHIAMEIQRKSKEETRTNKHVLGGQQWFGFSLLLPVDKQQSPNKNKGRVSIHRLRAMPRNRWQEKGRRASSEDKTRAAAMAARPRQSH